MTADPQLALARSPLGHRPGDTGPGEPAPLAGSAATVVLQELPFRSMLDLRLAPDGLAAQGVEQQLGLRLPRRAGVAMAAGPRAVLWLGPDWWLVVDAPGRAGPLAAALQSAGVGEPVSVVDVSAQRTTLRLAGPHARDVLQHGCSLDLHPRAFRPGSCAQTLLARAGVVVHQTGPEPEYRLYVRASYARYLADWLQDAMTEYVDAKETRG